MNASAILTAAFCASLMGLAGSLFVREFRSTAPPGDRSRRGRRMLGATLLGVVGAGLLLWDQIDVRANPLLFLNVTAVLLGLVLFLVLLAFADIRGVQRATRHRKLSMLTQELYGFPLKEMDGRDAEKVGRRALAQVLREQAKSRAAERRGAEEEDNG